jgi:hypothetical protein
MSTLIEYHFTSATPLKALHKVYRCCSLRYLRQLAEDDIRICVRQLVKQLWNFVGHRNRGCPLVKNAMLDAQIAAVHGDSTRATLLPQVVNACSDPTVWKHEVRSASLGLAADLRSRLPAPPGWLL